jgi:hypothetical protein
MLYFGMRAMAQQYITRGMKLDSMRRQLNRMGFQAPVATLRQLWQEGTEELMNATTLVGRRSNLRPLPGRDMLARTFKSPFNYRYAVKVNFLDPITGEARSSVLSVLSNDRLTKGEAQRRALGVATRSTDAAGKYGIVERGLVLDAVLENAYYNEGIGDEV